VTVCGVHQGVRSDDDCGDKYGLLAEGAGNWLEAGGVGPSLCIKLTVNRCANTSHSYAYPSIGPRKCAIVTLIGQQRAIGNDLRAHPV
jgi:hypothetical protein